MAGGMGAVVLVTSHPPQPRRPPLRRGLYLLAYLLLHDAGALLLRLLQEVVGGHFATAPANPAEPSVRMDEEPLPPVAREAFYCAFLCPHQHGLLLPPAVHDVPRLPVRLHRDHEAADTYRQTGATLRLLVFFLYILLSLLS